MTTKRISDAVAKVDECKKYNNQLWRCIETNDYKVGNCGEYYYKFYRCFNSLE